MFTISQLLLKLAQAQAFPPDLDPSEQLSRVNQALEAIFLSGRFNGTQRIAAFQVPASGILTLPRQALGVLAAKVNGVVREMGSPWYAFLAHTSDNLRIGDTTLIDLGDGYCTFAQPTEPAKLRITCEGETQQVKVIGLDESGAEVSSLLSPNAAATAPLMTKVLRVVKPETQNTATLLASYDSAKEDEIGIYAPGETVPSYRAYFVPEAVGAPTTVTAKVQLRHVDLTENDVCPIGNFIALKSAVASVHWNDQADESRANEHLNDALNMLNRELQVLRPPNERAAFRVSASNTGAIGLRSFR